MNKVTLDEIVTSIRELTFDRFVIPAFAIKQMEGYDLSIVRSTNTKSGSLTIHKAEDGEVKDNDIVANFAEVTTMSELMDFLIEHNIIVAYTPFFRDNVSVEQLLPCKNKNLSDEDVTIFRKYFFVEDDIKKLMVMYYWKVLDCFNVTEEDITDELVGHLVRPSEKHLVLWVSYFIVDKRRLYEAAAKKVGLTFTDGSDYDSSANADGATSTTVNIGSVFTITEDSGSGDLNDEFYMVGSDNIWGDRYSFWYRLQCYIRDLLEQLFEDFSLRKNQVIEGITELRRELDFRAYYDSYPFTLSPLSRGIVSKEP